MTLSGSPSATRPEWCRLMGGRIDNVGPVLNDMTTSVTPDGNVACTLYRYGKPDSSAGFGAESRC